MNSHAKAVRAKENNLVTQQSNIAQINDAFQSPSGFVKRDMDLLTVDLSSGFHCNRLGCMKCGNMVRVIGLVPFRCSGPWKQAGFLFASEKHYYSRGGV